MTRASTDPAGPDPAPVPGRVPAPRPWTAPTAAGPIRATVRLAGSKSMTARALVLSALAEGPSTLRAPLRARDTELMVAGLAALGADLTTDHDQRWLVRPGPPRGNTHIEVGLAGTVMRFLPPVAGLADQPVTFDGDPYARSRPLGPLLGALRAIGVTIEGNSLPLTVRGGGGITGGEVSLDASASSQLVSGLLLAAPRFRRGVTVRHSGRRVPSRPYLRMTARMLRAAGGRVDDTAPDTWTVRPGQLTGRTWDIEPDLSTAAPYLAAAAVTGGEVTVPDWPANTTQPGDQFRGLLDRMGATCALSPSGLTVRGGGTIHGIEADLSDVSELTPVVAALCAVADGPSRLWGVAHIRGHETDRLAALARELSTLGAEVTEAPDGLTIRPRPLRGGPFRTYDDHRMAHAGAVLGLVVPGVELTDVACTTKTTPDFPDRWSGLAQGHREGAPGG